MEIKKAGKDLTESIINVHRQFYNSNMHSAVTWKGIHCLKCPMDLWVYQEILYEIKPDFIIETGTAFGGTTLYLADLMDTMNIPGHVFTIDNWSNDKINPIKLPVHGRIMYCNGNSINQDTLYFVNQYAKKAKKVMVILDSNHKKEHVYQEMELYSKYVTKDSYLIVEDTNINNHPVFPEFGEGPYEAVEQFIKSNNSFIIDRIKEKYILSYNHKGYLKKII